MNTTKEALFDAFNARNLSYDQVAKTFIPNKQFEDLADNNHALLMGPRGSGKTTLLKMLTPNAIDYYNENISRNIAKMPFYGIYIPTDTQFKRQLDYLEQKLDEDAFKLISTVIVNTNILVAISRTYKYLINKLNNQEIAEKEIDFSIKLIEYWRLKRPISPTIYSIEESLLTRISAINNICNKLIYTSVKSIVYENLADYYYDDFLTICDLACSAFEQIFLNQKECRWALCFDELELAPRWLQNNLLDFIRSVPQRFIFKLTTSPVISLSDAISEGISNINATHYNDYKIIRTWPINNNEIKKWNSFCEELVYSKLQRRYGTLINPLDLFGSDNLDRSLKYIRPDLNEKTLNIKDVYGKGSLNWHIFKDYAMIDKTFHEFLKYKKIDPLNPVYFNDQQKDTIFRKIKPIVFFRYNYRFNNKLRSRKNTILYYGIPYIYEICDGNPRQLIGLLDELLRRVKINDSNKPFALGVNIQSEVISNTSARFLKLLATHPDANVAFKQKNLNAAEVLVKIGSYFHEKLILDDFSNDPVGSFYVDKETDPKYLKIIEFCLAHGALVYVDPEEGVSNEGLLGKRLRLSYLLTPVFKLPKREYKAIRLSSIITYSLRRDNNQLNLFK